MVNIALALAHMLPSLVNGLDYEVHDNSDGNGPFIAVWASTTRQPTMEEMAAFEPQAMLANGEILYTAEVQKHLDKVAKQYGYDDIRSAVSYAGDLDPVFAAEGTAFLHWRSAVWRHCIGALAGVRAGETPLPIEEFLISLPAFALAD